jgi:hypothetical protein
MEKIHVVQRRNPSEKIQGENTQRAESRRNLGLPSREDEWREINTSLDSQIGRSRVGRREES